MTNIAEMMISPFDRVENTMGKGENSVHQHFLLFLFCFPKLSPLRTSGLCGNELRDWMKRNRREKEQKVKPFPKQALVFTCLQYKSFENTV